MKVLVISDTHITPKQTDIDSWYKLGAYAVSHKPDCIIHLGDVADLDSLAWLKNARGEFTTEQELATVSLHLEAFEARLSAEVDKNRHDKKAMYKPRKILCLGNHDVRNNYTGIKELFESYGWEVHNYLDIVNIDGICFSHCVHRNLSDTVCTTAEEVLNTWHCNFVIGHSHIRDYAESYSAASDSTIKVVKCPMFNDIQTGWDEQVRKRWSKGFTVIDTDGFNFVWRDMKCLHKIS